jgi:hypothetical protein
MIPVETSMKEDIQHLGILVEMLDEDRDEKHFVALVQDIMLFRVKWVLWEKDIPDYSEVVMGKPKAGDPQPPKQELKRKR